MKAGRGLGSFTPVSSEANHKSTLEECLKVTLWGNPAELLIVHLPKTT